MIIFWLHSSSNTLSRYKLFSFCIIFLKIGTLRWRIMIMREPWLWIIILGLKQIKLYVKEIVSQLEIADVIFRRKRSNDRKYVCVSQAKWWSTLCSNKSKQLLKLSPFTLSFGSAQMLSEHLQTFPAMLGSLRKVIRNLQKSLRHFGNPSHDKVTISSIWLRKSGQVYNSCNVDVSMLMSMYQSTDLCVSFFAL